MSDHVSATTVWGLAAARAAATPDQWAVLGDPSHRETFGELIDRAERVAAGLQRMGVGAGTRVSWQLPTRPDSIALLLALARLGAFQNPLVPFYRQREIGSVLRQFNPSWYIVPAEWRGFDHHALAQEMTADRDDVRVLVLDGVLDEGDPSSLPPAPLASSGDDVRWIYTTSGTTSEPKCARHSDSALIAAGQTLVGVTAATADDVACMPFPIAHIGGMMQLCASLVGGYPVLLVDPFIPGPAVVSMRAGGATLMGGGTPHYVAMLGEQRKDPATPLLPALRAMVGGGAPKPPEVYWQVLDEVGARIVHGYGMTECPYLCSGRVTDTDEQLANTDGRPVPGTELRICGPDGAEVGPGDDGEVLVRSPMLCRGYLDPEATAASFTEDGFFRTGDRGHLRADGHIQLTGRIKDIIIRKGENISAVEIEMLMRDMASVGDVAVIGLPDAERGERVCAVVERFADVDPPTLADVRDLFRSKQVMMQKVPEQLEIVDELPRNASLKILKNELRQRFS